MKSKNRKFYHYAQLEEVSAGMWRIVRGEERKKCIERSANLMRNCDEFEKAMREAIQKWPRSCEAIFTADSMNHIAWLGCAGCCISAKSPEECTRCAWHMLSYEQQDAANEAAFRALKSWPHVDSMQLDLFIC